MPHKQLQEALAALHQELASAEALSAEERNALSKAIEEIKEALDRGVDREPVTRTHEPLSGRVAALIEGFEVSHPRFAELLRNVSESLSNIGI